MKKIYKTIKKCRGCGNKNLSKIYYNRPSPIGEAFLKKKDLEIITNKLYPLNLVICNKCKLCQLDIVVNPDILYKDYLYLTSTSFELLTHFKNTSKLLISKLKLKNTSKVLEIGSNDGSLLNYFKAKGFDVLGIEPAKPASKISRSKGIKTLNNFFDKKFVKNLGHKLRSYELIIANNVFANIDQINEWFRLIKIILSENGSFVFESSYLADILFNNVFDFIYHEHLSYFTITSVNNLCKKNGLILFDVDHISTKGGSIRYYITKNTNKKINKKVTIFLKKEKDNKLFHKSTFNKLKEKINNKKIKLNNFVKNNSDKNIIGFGASISCITLIYEFGLENKFKFLIDDNNIKQNKYSPGSNIKILNPKKNKLSKNDIILILPWRYQKMILKKHKKTLNKADKIVQVWPKFRILK
mgnify:CR=1 FL=1